MIDERRPCADCGREQRLYVAQNSPGLILMIARSQLASESPVLCEGCAAAREQEAELHEERERQRERVEKRLGRSGIPRKWRSAVFESIEDDAPRREAIGAAMEWGLGERRGLLLHGPVGRGKTAIAAAAAVARLQIQAVRWIGVADLLLTLSLPFDAPERAKALRALQIGDRRVALVLDDLDKAKPTDHALAPLFVAVNEWVEAEQPLLVTLNRTLDELAADFGDRFGEPIASRLAEHCKLVEVGGRDRRIEP